MDEKTSNYAYFCLVMCGDSYAIGAMVVAHSLRRSGTKNDIICMVTNDISQGAINKLKLFFSRVVFVDYIYIKTKRIKFNKIRKMYGSWISKSFTKWNILLFNEYEKVMFLDADVIIKHNIDNLFDLNTPAATFDLPQKKSNKNRNGIYNPYNATHGELVSSSSINRGLGLDGKVSFACIGTTIILSPDKKHFEQFKNELKKAEPFGFTKCINGFDEQSIVWYYSVVLKQRWTHIDCSYNMVVGKVNKWKHKNPIKVLHYVGGKPWNMRRDEWPDLVEWWEFADEVFKVVH